MSKTENIHPVFDRMLSRAEREEKYGQKSIALWFTGLSGSGKSTIAIALERKLFGMGYSVQLLDGDNIRSGINSNLGFAKEDRSENIRRISEVSKLFVQAGMISINCFISPTIEMREMARDIIGENDFKEVYINTPLEVCEARDVKGLYAKARKGEIKNFTGIDAPYEEPVNPDFIIMTENKTVEECVDTLMAGILPLIDNRPTV
jgi:adenylylsulfate kinase